MKKNASGSDRQTLQHEAWCDPKQHAQAASDDLGLGECGCVGRLVEVGEALGGWWHQREPGGAPHFAVDGRGISWDPSVRDLRAVYDLLSTGETDQLLYLCERALGELEHGSGVAR